MHGNQISIQYANTSNANKVLNCQMIFELWVQNI